MCPYEWRIAYSGDDFVDILNSGARYIDLGYDVEDHPMPARTYAGGIKYSKVLDLINFFQAVNPGVPPPIPVDVIESSMLQ